MRKSGVYLRAKLGPSSTIDQTQAVAQQLAEKPAGVPVLTLFMFFRIGMKKSNVFRRGDDT